MNVTGAWAAGYTGKGVKVAIVDSGLEIAHEDLAANVDEANCYNFVTRSNDPTPGSFRSRRGSRNAGGRHHRRRRLQRQGRPGCCL